MSAIAKAIALVALTFMAIEFHNFLCGIAAVVCLLSLLLGEDCYE